MPSLSRRALVTLAALGPAAALAAPGSAATGSGAPPSPPEAEALLERAAYRGDLDVMLRKADERGQDRRGGGRGAGPRRGGGGGRGWGRRGRARRRAPRYPPQPIAPATARAAPATPPCSPRRSRPCKLQTGCSRTPALSSAAARPPL